MFKRTTRGIILFILSNAAVFFPITALAADPSFIITPLASPNGTISPSLPLTVNSGSNITFTATPQTNFMAFQWSVDGKVVQTGGVNFILKKITANHTVKILFQPLHLIYAGGANGYVYYTMNGGVAWPNTPTRPNASNPIKSMFATSTDLYVSTTNNRVYRSRDNGVTWTTSSPSPDASGVNSVFVTPSNILYIATAKGNLYRSSDLGVTWMAQSPPNPGQAIHSIFVKNNYIYAGSADGNVYYSSNGISWFKINGSPDGSPVRSVFVTNNMIYVNTANEFVYNSSNVSGGGSWSLFAQTVYSLFVSPNGNILDVATQQGYLYSLVTGNNLGFIARVPINCLFWLG